MSASFIISTIGILITVVGGLCLAYELARPFEGNPYGGVDASNADGLVRPTPEYRRWERTKRRWHFCGIALVLIGSAVQIVGARLADTASKYEPQQQSPQPTAASAPSDGQ